MHHLYDSFATTFEAFVRGAATDPAVTAMKTTVYRTSGDSPLVPALVECAEAGKQSVCLVELKARFDGEHRVVTSARARRRARRLWVPEPEDPREDDADRPAGGGRPRRYVHLGTGNYLAHRADLRGPRALHRGRGHCGGSPTSSTTSQGSGARSASRSSSSPRSGSEGLIDEIQLVTAAAKAGKTARIRFKVNALTDPKIIQALYAASQAGAEIDIFAQSISSLWPGLDGISETIRVRSVLGQFLEHSRVFAFQAGKRSVYYLGSADLMPRNLDNRLEILAPVENTLIQQRLSGVFDVLLQDNFQAWDLRRTEPAALATEEGRDEARDARRADAQGGAPQPSFTPLPDPVTSGLLEIPAR